MTDNVFRTKVEPTSTDEVKFETKDPEATTPVINEEVPFTDYESINHHPFLVDYFELGDSWKDKLGGFEKEIDLIEGYFKGKIDNGQIKNEIPAIKEKLKSIYKLCNIDRTERTTMQIEKLAAYIKFLKNTDDIDMNNLRYGNQHYSK